MRFFEFLQQLQRVFVIGAGAGFFVQALGGFQVVVHDIGRGGIQNTQRTVQATPEVGHQNFDFGVGRQFTGFFNTGHKMAGATITQIIAVYAGNDHVVQTQGGNGFCQIQGFVFIERIGATMAHIAEGATAGALVAHDHEGGGAFAKTLTNVGARSLFAHGVQFVLAQNFLDFVKTGRRRAGLHADPAGFFQLLEGHNLDGNSGGFRGRFLLDGRIADCAQFFSHSGLFIDLGHVFCSLAVG